MSALPSRLHVILAIIAVSTYPTTLTNPVVGPAVR